MVRSQEGYSKMDSLHEIARLLDKFEEYFHYQIDKTVTPHFGHNFHEFL